MSWLSGVSNLMGGSTGQALTKAVSGSSSSSGWGAIGSLVSGFLGGGSNSGSAGGSDNIWGSVLAGLGGAATGYLSGKDLKEQAEARGFQDRKTIDFEYQMKDYYEQKDKVRKRAALDTYGQFSLTDRFAPGMTAAPPVQQSAKPGVN